MILILQVWPAGTCQAWPERIGITNFSTTVLFGSLWILVYKSLFTFRGLSLP